jgi:hypothetical protein
MIDEYLLYDLGRAASWGPPPPPLGQIEHRAGQLRRANRLRSTGVTVAAAGATTVLVVTATSLLPAGRAHGVRPGDVPPSLVVDTGGAPPVAVSTPPTGASSLPPVTIPPPSPTATPTPATASPVPSLVTVTPEPTRTGPSADPTATSASPTATPTPASTLAPSAQ